MYICGKCTGKVKINIGMDYWNGILDWITGIITFKPGTFGWHKTGFLKLLLSMMCVCMCVCPPPKAFT